MSDLNDLGREKRLEALSKVRTYKKSVHPDFDWWQERERVAGGTYEYLNRGGTVAPPQEVLETLDKFESILNWLDNRQVGKEMTAYEKAQIACKLLDLTSTREVSLASDSLDVNLKGDYSYPVYVKSDSVEVTVQGDYSNPIPITKMD